jgi:hypothetical protein
MENHIDYWLILRIGLWVLILIPLLMFAFGKCLRSLGKCLRFSPIMGEFGLFLSGVGTLVIAMAAVLAAFKADSLLDRVIQVKDTVDQIKVGVVELKVAVAELKDERQGLRNDRADLKIQKATANNPAILNPNTTTKELRKAIQPLLAPIGISVEYKIPNEKLDEVIEKFKTTTAPSARQDILRQYMLFPKK